MWLNRVHVCMTHCRMITANQITDLCKTSIKYKSQHIQTACCDTFSPLQVSLQQRDKHICNMSSMLNNKRCLQNLLQEWFTWAFSGLPSTVHVWLGQLLWWDYGHREIVAVFKRNWLLKRWQLRGHRYEQLRWVLTNTTDQATNTQDTTQQTCQIFR